MSPPRSPRPARHLRASDIRGIALLATQATIQVSHIVEGVHQSVWRTLGVPGGEAHGQTGGITGRVYRGVRGITQQVGKGMDTGLATLLPLIASADEPAAGTPRREALLAALNGVMGDSLAASGNPLATPMTLRYRGEVLDSQVPMVEATGKLVLLIHGLCMNDLQWHTQRNGQVVDHGEALADALGYTPIHLRYNTGLHVSQNGHELATQLEHLVDHWPVPIEELTIVAHSMGGLVTRSAVHYARQAALRWPGHLKSIVFLGTPHHGAPLERAGNWVDAILGRIPYAAPFARLGRLRSAGITDLRYGHVLDADWQGHDRFARKPDTRTALPLPDGVACYAIAATTARRRSVLADRLVGDGLVPLHSALGMHAEASRQLAFAPAAQWIGYRMSHLELLSRPEVTQQLLHWLTPAA